MLSASTRVAVRQSDCDKSSGAEVEDEKTDPGVTSTDPDVAQALRERDDWEEQWNRHLADV